MIPRKSLRSWLSSGDAQRASTVRFEEVAAQLKTLPLVSGLRRKLAQLPDPTPHAILTAAGEQMADDGAVEQFLACLIDAAAADPFFRPALRTVSTDLHAGLLLYDEPDLTLFLSVLPADALAAKRTDATGPRSVVFSGQHSLHKFIRAGGATLSLWEAPPIEPGFTAAASGRCRCVGRRHMADGDFLRLDGRRQTFVIDHATGDLVYLQALTGKGRGPLAVEYDTVSHQFTGASSTDEISSRTQMMLSLLRTMERTDAVPMMIAMLHDANFYARWQTMRELLALDAETALPHLRVMADRDPHPEVRAAAMATLSFCFPAVDADLAPAPADVLEVL